MEQLTSAQFSEWEAYDKIDPIGSWREDFRMANLAALITNIANSLYGEKGKTKTVTPLDFMPDWAGDKKKKQQQKPDHERFKQILMGVAAAQNKKVMAENKRKSKAK